MPVYNIDTGQVESINVLVDQMLSYPEYQKKLKDPGHPFSEILERPNIRAAMLNPTLVTQNPELILLILKDAFVGGLIIGRMLSEGQTLQTLQNSEGPGGLEV